MLGTDIDALRQQVPMQPLEPYTNNTGLQSSDIDGMNSHQKQQITQQQYDEMRQQQLMLQQGQNDDDMDNIAQGINNMVSENFESGKNEKTQNQLYDALYEIVLLVVIYYIMSLESVKSIVGKYVTLVNPVNGTVSLYGILFYGLLLSVLFVVAKKFIFKKSLFDKLRSN
jgi:hypothetical protein